MAIQSSGQISLSDLAAEFGGAAPHSLSEYGQPIINKSSNIKLSDFYGVASEVQVRFNASTVTDTSTNVTWGDRRWKGYKSTKSVWLDGGAHYGYTDRILQWDAYQKGPIRLSWTCTHTGTYRFRVGNSTAYGNIGYSEQKVYINGVEKISQRCPFGGNVTQSVSINQGDTVYMTQQSQNSHYYNSQWGDMRAPEAPQGNGIDTFYRRIG